MTDDRYAILLRRYVAHASVDQDLYDCGIALPDTFAEIRPYLDDHIHLPFEQ